MSTAENAFRPSLFLSPLYSSEMFRGSNLFGIISMHVLILCAIYNICVYIYTSLSLYVHTCMHGLSLSIYGLHMYLHANVYQTPLQIIPVA